MTLILGLGIIGSRSADQLAAAGHPVKTWNRTPKERADSVDDPTLAAEDSEIIVSYLRDDVAVRELFERIKPALTEGKTFINHSTIDADTTTWLDNQCREIGCDFLDAPFTGSRDAAAGGNLVYYVAGNPEILEKHRALLGITSKAIVYLGLPPAATVVKITTNLVTASAVQALTEALEISRRHGVDPRAWHEAAKLNGCYAGAHGMKIPTLLENDFTPHFSVENMLKDVDYAHQMAHASGTVATGVKTTRDQLSFAQPNFGAQDFSAVRIMNYSQTGPADMINLSPSTVIKVEGPDAVRFLNGQISNDVVLTENHQAISACLLNAKGQMEAYVQLLKNEGTFYLTANSTLKKTLFERLDKYLIADDVTLTDVSEDFDLTYSSGEVAPKVFLQFGGTIFHTNHLGEKGTLSLVPKNKLEVESWPHAAAASEASRIERGIPRWPNEIFPGLLPAEAGLDKTAVSFTKGCYTGQEVVSRMKRAGKTNKHLVKLTLDKPLVPTKSKLIIDGKKAGWITSVATLVDGTEIALGYRLRKFETAETFEIQSPFSGEIIAKASIRS